MMADGKYAYESIGLTPKGIFWLYAGTVEDILEQLKAEELRHESYDTVAQAKAKCRLIFADMVKMLEEK